MAIPKTSNATAPKAKAPAAGGLGAAAKKPAASKAPGYGGGSSFSPAGGAGGPPPSPGAMQSLQSEMAQMKPEELKEFQQLAKQDPKKAADFIRQKREDRVKELALKLSNLAKANHEMTMAMYANLK